MTDRVAFAGEITAGTAPAEPPSCKDGRCKRPLPQGWKLLYCRRCLARSVKRGQNAKEARMRPGVDIDRIHYLRGAVVTKAKGKKHG